MCGESRVVLLARQLRLRLLMKICKMQQRNLLKVCLITVSSGTMFFRTD